MEKRAKRIIYFFIALFFLYLFVLSLLLMKEGAFRIGSDVFRLTIKDMNAVNALGFGWLLSLILQSSGATSSALIAMHSAGLLGGILLVYMIIGTRIGTSITMIISSLFVHAKKRRDFRHGFEIGLANIVYAFPIVLIMFFLEVFFGLFSGLELGSFKGGDIWNLNFAVIFEPIVNLTHLISPVYAFLTGLVFLIISLDGLPKAFLRIYGRKELTKKLHKHLGRKNRAFFAGFFFTVMLLSTSITLTLLLPFIVARFVNLRKVIPFLIGANLGGVVDVILSSLVIGPSAFSGAITYGLFNFIGLLWLLNTDLLFNITKYASKRILHVSRARAFIFLCLFILLAIVLAFVRF